MSGRAHRRRRRWRRGRRGGLQALQQTKVDPHRSGSIFLNLELRIVDHTAEPRELRPGLDQAAQHHGDIQQAGALAHGLRRLCCLLQPSHQGLHDPQALYSRYGGCWKTSSRAATAHRASVRIRACPHPTTSKASDAGPPCGPPAMPRGAGLEPGQLRDQDREGRAQGAQLTLQDSCPGRVNATWRKIGTTPRELLGSGPVARPSRDQRTKAEGSGHAIRGHVANHTSSQERCASVTDALGSGERNVEVARSL